MPDGQSLHVRPAISADVPVIANLLVAPAAQGLVLPRTADDINALIGNFLVAQIDREAVGAVALRDYGNGLFEVRSLVVRPDMMNRRIGTALVQAALDTAADRQARTVFALTYHPRLFERLGFRQVRKERFPQKVWLDCAKCRKRDCCDEIAVIYDMHHDRNVS
jgi:amino-acid N-acetyltransferase